ncbi:MAG TPA: helix-turn-helix domain-containing protein [Solirubrobacteraceae bacterium]|nr:helix-turn-helix domain-containing protein [Solirubrobacteraceae bacterium]
MTRWQPDAQGRLLQAAIELFSEQGYDATTVAEIAERAGLTKRTFFRHFSDKREVLFGGGGAFEEMWVQAVRDAPAQASPLEAALAGTAGVAEFFAERFGSARLRSRIIEVNPELRERELIKLQHLAEVTAQALVQRGVAAGPARLSAQTAVTVFQTGWARWVLQDDPDALAGFMAEALAELRALTAA